MELNELTLLPIPTDFPQWRTSEIERYRTHLQDASKVRLENSVRYWRTDNAVIPPFVYKDACVECPKSQLDAYKNHLEEFTKKYLEQQQREDEMRVEIKRKAKYKIPLTKAEEMLVENDAEQAFEMRAAFGESAEVVNVLTGKKTKV